MKEEERRKHTPVHTQPLQPAVILEGGSQTATPLTAQSQNAWKEGAEVELLPNFSKEERESNLSLLYVGQDRKKDGKENRPSAYPAPRNPPETLTSKVGTLKWATAPEAVKAGTC